MGSNRGTVAGRRSTQLPSVLLGLIGVVSLAPLPGCVAEGGQAFRGIVTIRDHDGQTPSGRWMIEATWFADDSDALHAPDDDTRGELPRKRILREADTSSGLGRTPFFGVTDVAGRGELVFESGFQAYWMLYLNPDFYQDVVFQSLSPEGIYMEITPEEGLHEGGIARARQRFLIISGDEGPAVVRIPRQDEDPDVHEVAGTVSRAVEPSRNGGEVWNIFISLAPR